ncbi:hypothetical protein CHUAL_005163 [Chamberlinius hualienensis]
MVEAMLKMSKFPIVTLENGLCQYFVVSVKTTLGDRMIIRAYTSISLAYQCDETFLIEEMTNRNLDFKILAKSLLHHNWLENRVILIDRSDTKLANLVAYLIESNYKYSYKVHKSLPPKLLGEPKERTEPGTTSNLKLPRRGIHRVIFISPGKV